MFVCVKREKEFSLFHNIFFYHETVLYYLHIHFIISLFPIIYFLLVYFPTYQFFTTLLFHLSPFVHYFSLTTSSISFKKIGLVPYNMGWLKCTIVRY